MTIFIGGTYTSNTKKTRQLFGGVDGMAAWQHAVHDIDLAGRVSRSIIAPWEGGNNDSARTSGVLNVEHAYIQWFSERGINDTCTIIGFSHGGNIAIMALRRLSQTHLLLEMRTRLVTLATPAFEEYLDYANGLGERVRIPWYNVYDPNDSVQGRLAGIRLTDDFHLGGQTYGWSRDIPVDTGGGPLTSHRLVAKGHVSQRELAKLWMHE